MKKRKNHGKELENKIKLLRQEIDDLKKNIDDINSIENHDFTMVKNYFKIKLLLIFISQPCQILLKLIIN